MKPDKLDILSADHAAELLRKRGFWRRTMSMSLRVGIILALLSISGTVIGMIRAFSTLKQTGSADPSKLAGDISQSMLITMWTAPLISLAFLLAMVSYIRLLSLPKPPKA